jgi:hypothetical protein
MFRRIASIETTDMKRPEDKGSSEDGILTAPSDRGGIGRESTREVENVQIDFQSDGRLNLCHRYRDCGPKRARAARPYVPRCSSGVSPLRANAGDPTAAWVQQELQGQLAQALSGRMARNGASLIVRIDYLTLGPNTGEMLHAASSLDNINGVAIIGGEQIPVRATTSYYTSPIDQTMIEQSNHARVSELTQTLADWIARGAFF